jgi:hypothetical protein
MDCVLCNRIEWETEIKRRANSLPYLLRKMVGIAVFAVMLLAAVVGVLLNLAGNNPVVVFGWTVPHEVSGPLLIVAAVLGALLGLGFLQQRIQGWFASASTRYRACAHAIIDELEVGHFVTDTGEYGISRQTARDLRVYANELPVRFESRKEASQILQDVSFKLAECMCAAKGSSGGSTGKGTPKYRSIIDPPRENSTERES